MGLSDRCHRLKGKGLLDYKRAEKGEWHAPFANYCGPGTNLRDRLKKGVIPTTKTDSACRTHDIDYQNIGSRLARGRITREQAKELVRKSDTKLMRAAAMNKINPWNAMNPVEHLHSTGVLAGMAGKKLLEKTGLMDELKFVSQRDEDELTGSGKTKTRRKKNLVSGLQKRFKKLKV